ncbi:MAG TPA: sulfur transferase domain-containing protein [Iamia sp.]
MIRRARQVVIALVGGVLALNLWVLVASGIALALVDNADVPASVAGIRNVVAVDDEVWRGGAPSPEEYELLAAAGVEVVVDLRAEDDAAESHDAARAAGLWVVHLPVRDGQPPSTQQIRRFLGLVAAVESPVYVHCGAGVGRTGAMAGAYLLRRGEASRPEAVARNLAVGPPSLEQLAFVGTGALEHPPWPLVAVSRVADAPRRLWATLR